MHLCCAFYFCPQRRLIAILQLVDPAYAAAQEHDKT